MIAASADARPGAVALHVGSERLSYGELAVKVRRVADGFRALGVSRRDRVAIFLPKSFESVIAMFGASAAGAVFVPVNPVLKAAQVAHILRDSGARLLVTSGSRAATLEAELASCSELRGIVLTDESAADQIGSITPVGWGALLESPPAAHTRAIDTDAGTLRHPIVNVNFIE